jgi:hypothetical protein
MVGARPLEKSAFTFVWDMSESLSVSLCLGNRIVSWNKLTIQRWMRISNNSLEGFCENRENLLASLRN